MLIWTSWLVTGMLFFETLKNLKYLKDFDVIYLNNKYGGQGGLKSILTFLLLLIEEKECQLPATCYFFPEFKKYCS